MTHLILKSINPSINRNLYSASLRSLLRSAPDPGQAEKNCSLEKVVELRIIDDTYASTLVDGTPTLW